MRTVSGRRLVLAAALAALLGSPVSEALGQTYLDLAQFEQRFGSAIGPVDRSVLGFLSLTERFSFNALLGGPGGVSEFRSFTDEARSVVDTVPIPSGSISVAYTFDPALETFVRWERPLAPAISQNARTNGRNVLTLGVSSSYLDFQQFNDSEHDDAIFTAGETITFPGVSELEGFSVRDVLYYNFKLRQQVWGFAFQFGVLDNLDVGVLVPLIDLDFRGKAIDAFAVRQPDGSVTLVDLTTLQVGRNVPGGFESLQQADFQFLAYPGIRHQESRADVGDVLLRAKYFLGATGPLDWGVLFGTWLPTGDDDDLFGVGSVRFDPRLIVSAGGPRLAAHFNGGYHADADESARNRFDYSVGGELAVTSWMTLVVDQISRIGIEGETQVRKFEIAPGVKVNPADDVVLGFNAIVPLNREGLTTEWTPNGIAEVSARF